MKFQIISRDEYGQTSILKTSENISEALEFMSDQIQDMNFANALTPDDQLNTIEAYSIMFTDDKGEINNQMIYLGNTTDGRHRYVDASSNNKDIRVFSDMDIRVFIGYNPNAKKDEEKELYFLSTSKGERVSSVSDPILEGKTLFFIKVIDSPGG